DRGQKFNAQQERPDVNFFRPPRLEGPGLAMMRLGHCRISFKLLDQNVVGVRLLPREIDVEDQQWNQAHNRNVVRRRTNFPELSPIHKVSRPAKPEVLSFRSGARNLLIPTTQQVHYSPA